MKLNPFRVREAEGRPLNIKPRRWKVLQKELELYKKHIGHVGVTRDFEGEIINAAIEEQIDGVVVIWLKDGSPFGLKVFSDQLTTCRTCYPCEK